MKSLIMEVLDFFFFVVLYYILMKASQTIPDVDMGSWQFWLLAILIMPATIILIHRTIYRMCPEYTKNLEQYR